MIPGVDHIGIAVRSIAEALPLWQALGLRVEHLEEVPQEGVRVAMIPCGEVRIELLEPTREDSPIARFLERRGPGIHHLCLRSDDLRGDDRRLREAGLELLRAEPSRGAGGCWVQFVHPRSASGVLLELSQPGSEAAASDGEPNGAPPGGAGPDGSAPAASPGAGAERRSRQLSALAAAAPTAPTAPATGGTQVGLPGSARAGAAGGKAG